MILRGLIDRSLGNMVCIRGFAKMGDLARVSKADESYQRDLIIEHKEEILKFLYKRETLFFPEVTLSYGIDELPVILEKFKYSNKELKITAKTSQYKNKQDARGVSTMQIATVDITATEILENKSNLVDGNIGFENTILLGNTSTSITISKIFNRIDGNHRLSAADEEIDDQYIQDLITPFCLLLLPKQFEQNLNTFEELTTAKLEKTIFHNINYKHIPLKKEHHYKMIIADSSVFSSMELSNNFGATYFCARQYLQEFGYSEFGSLNTALQDNIYTFTHDLQKLLLKKDRQKREDSEDSEDIHKALTITNKIYGNYPQLLECGNYGLVIAFVYFAIRYKNSLSEKELNAFAHWVCENFVYQIAKKDANSIVAMYEQIIERRYKKIFISMDFDEKHEDTYQAIDGAIKEINQEFTLDIKIETLRIDEHKTGTSYVLTDEIMKQIEKECGLMIADLSSENINVYQEVGFLMGINRYNNTNNNILLLMKEGDKKNVNDKVGFNLRSTKQIRFKNTEILRQMLKSELIEFYKL